MCPHRCYWLFPIKKFLRARICLSAIALGLGAPANAQLSFDAALSQALLSAPQLHASQANLNAAQQAAIPAAALPDPKLSIGINNMPVAGDQRFSSSADFMTMRQIGVMQEFPNRAKRHARQAEADSEIQLAEMQIALDQRALLLATATSWIQLRSIEQQLALLTRIEQENQLLTKSHEASHTGKQSMVMDTLIPEQENALLAQRRDELLRLQTRAQAQLQRWIGNAAAQPLSGRAPHWPLALGELQAALNANPELQIYESMERKLDARVAAARANKHPDWALEAMYGARGYPAEDMVSIKFTVDLPVFSRNRQNPRIAASLSERDALASERAQKLRNLHAELASDYADYQQLQRAHKRQRYTLLPLADKKIALIQAAWQSNQGMSLPDVIHARQARLEAQFTLLQLASARDQAAAQLYYRYAISATDIQQLTRGLSAASGAAQ